MNESNLKSAVLKIRPYVIAILIGLSISFLLKITIHPYFVRGDSMYPTYKSGMVVRTDPDFKELKYGDIVVFKYSGNIYGFKQSTCLIKRVIALPGDTIYIKDGYLYINDKKDIYGYEPIDKEHYGLVDKPITIGDDMVFCVGDNRNASYDSRMFGCVYYSDIVGKVE